MLSEPLGLFAVADINDQARRRLMHQRRVRLFERKRDQLREDMGGVCVCCGAKKRLEFHHTHERTWVARKVSRWHRMTLYRRDWEAGHLELRCKKCHGRGRRAAE